jgi:hypothetical protein
MPVPITLGPQKGGLTQMITKSAVTFWSLDIGTVQVRLDPEQAPPQKNRRRVLVPLCAVSWTLSPRSKVAWQLESHRPIPGPLT